MPPKPATTATAPRPGYRSFALAEPLAARPWRLRPLWKISTVEECLNLDRRAVMQRVEDGRLFWVFRLSGVHTRRRELRCLAACVMELQGLPTGLPKPTSALSFAEVVELVLPHHRPELRGVELQRVFSCKPDLIRQLGTRRALNIAVRGNGKTGPNASHKFTRASVVRFLETSRFT